MRRRRCTIDSSCVIALDHLGLVPKLSFLFSRVLVPKAVREDLFKRRETKDRLQRSFDDFAFFERCDEYDRGTVEFLLAERARGGHKDRGETEAIIQAVQEGAMVIVDDPWGRQLARRYGCPCHGTIWVLQQLFELKLLSASDLRNGFSRLRERGTRLPWDDVNELLRKLGEDPLLG